MTGVHGVDVGVEVVSPHSRYGIGVVRLHTEFTYNWNIRAGCCFRAFESQSISDAREFRARRGNLE